MLSSVKVYAHAVGGTEKMRKERCGFLCDIGGPSSSYFKSGSTYGPPPLQQWFIPHHIASHTASSEGPRLLDGDVVMCIGHVQHAEVVRSVAKVKLAGWFGQGSGFNYSPETEVYIDESVDATLHCDEGKCPSYTIEQWSQLMESYPKALRAMRGKQIGSFVWTRQMRFTHSKRACGYTTSAFYNQWGLNACTNPQFGVQDSPSFWVLAVENAIVNHAERKLGKLCGKHDMFADTDTNVLELSTTLRELSKSADVALTFSHIYAAYSAALDILREEFKSTVYEVFADATLYVLRNLNTVCHNAARDAFGAPRADTLHVTGKIPTAGGIKEYDAYTVHCALRRMAAWEPPSHSQHYDFLLACQRLGEMRRLNPGIDIRYPPAIALREAVQRHFDGSIHVWHDLGFDPQNDDWLALQTLQAVFE